MQRIHYSALRQLALPILLALAGTGMVCAQTSAVNPFLGSVTTRPATDETLKLSLDDAVRMGLENNLGLRQVANVEKSLHGVKNLALQNFLPNIAISGDIGVHQQDLKALGFGPKVIGKLAPLFPDIDPASFSYITRDTLTEGKVQMSQVLFSGPVIAGWRAAGAGLNAAHFQKMAAREEVVQQVASAYLHAVAAASEVDTARALETADQLLFDQTHEAHLAGTVANLDELRARVQLQAQQQSLIAAQNTLEKDLIQLKREIGVAPGQRVALTDPAPYSDLATQNVDDILTSAYKSRNDYRSLQNQAIEFRAIHAARRSERLPTLGLGGFYAVSSVTGINANGNFAVQGQLSVPIFREAQLRGEEEVTRAEYDAVMAQLADKRVQIEQQVRSALLDVEATSKLVAVAQSNVEMTTRTVADETERVQAGIDDNLPLVTAQATLASAHTSLVESLYQYNVSKLELAQATGVLEEQYKAYLGH